MKVLCSTMPSINFWVLIAAKKTAISKYVRGKYVALVVKSTRVPGCRIT